VSHEPRLTTEEGIGHFERSVTDHCENQVTKVWRHSSN
jgi:hypothetical protein